MGCNCGKQRRTSAQRMEAVLGTGEPAEAPYPDAAVIAAARSGGQWRLKTRAGTTYSFPTLAAARDAQREHGGSINRDPR